VECQELQDFCRLLYGAKRIVGETIAASPEWRRFLAPIWSFHNLALSSLLPLNHPLLFSDEVYQQLDQEIRKLSLFSSSEAAKSGENIFEALQICRKLAVSPLLDVTEDLVLGILEESDNALPKVLLPHGNREIARETQTQLKEFLKEDFLVFSLGEQQQYFDCLRKGGFFIVPGKLERLYAPILRASLGDLSLTMIQYSWMRMRDICELVGPSFEEFRLNNETSGRIGHTRIQERALEFSVGSKSSHEVSQKLQEDEECPFSQGFDWSNLVFFSEEAEWHEGLLGLEDDSHESIFGESDQANGEDDFIKSIILRLSRFRAVALPLEGECYVLRHCEDKVSFFAKVLRLEAQEVRPGDFFVVHDGNSQKSIQQKVANRVPLHLLKEIRQSQKQWKTSLSHLIEELGFDGAIESINAHGPTLDLKGHHLRNWIRKDTICPRNIQTFRALCLACDLESCWERAWELASKLKVAHVQAGKELNKKGREMIKENLDSEFFSHDEFSQDGLSFLRIEQVSGRAFPVVADRLRQVIGPLDEFVFEHLEE